MEIWAPFRSLKGLIFYRESKLVGKLSFKEPLRLSLRLRLARQVLDHSNRGIEHENAC